MPKLTKGEINLRKKTLFFILLSILAITLTSGIVVVTRPFSNRQKPNHTDVSAATNGDVNGNSPTNNNDFTYIPPIPADPNEEIDEELTELPEEEEVPEVTEPFVPASEMDLDPTSITVYVNKEYTLPKDFRPERLITPNVKFNLTYYDERTLMHPEAAEALEKLFQAAANEGQVLCGISAYRSYERQYKIFTTNIVKKGKSHTLKYSAVPGTSEHQTGLAIDVSTESNNFRLSSAFSESPEGKWLAKNAHRFGYIIRYPRGKSDITGYAYEPWHIRYVGKDLANYLYTNDLTLDEYYNYTPSPDFNFEEKYADLINYIPPAVTDIPGEGDDLIIGENGEIIDVGIEGELTPTPEPASPSPKPTKPPKDDNITNPPEEMEDPEEGEGQITDMPEDPDDENSSEEGNNEELSDNPIENGDDDDSNSTEDDKEEPSPTASPSPTPSLTPIVTPTITPTITPTDIP